jgi:ketosteroid isomerase-like protein
MRKRVLMVLVLLLAATAAQAQSNGGSAEADAVLAVQARWFKATAGCNLPEIEATMSPDFMFLHHSGFTQTYEEAMAPYRKCSPRTGEPQQSTNTKVRVVGDTAIVVGDLQWGNLTPKAGEKGSFLKPTGTGSFALFRYSHVFARQNGSWRLMQQQSTAVPSKDFSSE